MTKICKDCNWPMFVIKANVGVVGWTSNHKYENTVKEPIIFYKCPKCGKLTEESIIKIQGVDGQGEPLN